MRRNEIIGKRIKFLREKEEYTQVELAKLLGLKSRGIISQVERGDRGLKGSNLSKTAEIFGVEEIALTASLELSHTSIQMITEFIRLLKKKSLKKKEKETLQMIKTILSRYI